MESLLLLCAIPEALASEQLHFENGGTATLTDEGTIVGTCHLEVVWHVEAETFVITMPDGQVLDGHCIDYGLVGPANDDYEFTATPNLDGSYQVRIHSDRAGYYATPNEPQVPANGANIQRVDLDDNWKPRYRKPKAKLTLRKSSDGPSATTSLAGAKYAVWRDAACSISAGPNTQLTTNADGTANTVTLEPGTYWVREFEAPAGFAIDPVAHEVTVEDEAIFELQVTDTPNREYPKVWINKGDAQYTAAQGAGSLAGAEFTMRYYDGIYTEQSLPAQPTRTWILLSDESGKVTPGKSALEGSDDFYTDEDGNAYLLWGTYTIQETKAPTGYWLEGQTPESGADYKAPIHLVHLDADHTYSTPNIENQIRRAGISLQKVDAETGDAQGDATLEGITFTIRNKSAHAVVVDGVTYQPEEVIGTFRTDEQGKITTANNYLPLGTYEIEESQTNGSLLLGAESQTITLDEADTNKVVPIPSPFADKVARGGIRVGKISRETQSHSGQANASLKGAQISVVNKSARPVLVNNVRYDVGEVVCTLVTDDLGYSETSVDALPYGSYLIQETKPPVGYLPNEEWSQEIQIREDGAMYDISDEQYAVEDQVIRGGFHFNKVDEESMERMPRTVFRVTSVSTGESHILVADGNGVASTEAATHTVRTNENDNAIDEEGNVDESKLDPTYGIWFSGGVGEGVEGVVVSDELGGLPYDSYRVEELPTSINTNKKLVSFLVNIQEHNVDVDMGTITNKNILSPNIKTSLTHDGSGHLAPVAEHIVLVDEVSYENLVVGESYVLRGELCFTSESTSQAEREYVCDADGAHISAELAFTPATSSGVVRLPFELDSNGLAGRSVVAIEHLMSQDSEIATHDDLTDAAQTVTFPSLETTFTDAEGNHDVDICGETTVSDTVRYENLDTTQNYEVLGTLMDAATELPLLDEHGVPVRGSTTFMPAEPSGTIQVDFALNTSEVAGKTIVAFEKLDYGGITLVAHEDLSNLDQTITVAGLKTTLTDTEGHHVLSPKDTVELVDTVTYAGLEPGASYTVSGTLMDRETGSPILDDTGMPLTSSTSFEPVDPDGSVEVRFSCPGNLLAGHIVVAFEELAYGERIIASHADINDEAQTVYMPSIKTTLGTTERSHSCVANTGVTLNDLVTYQGLCAGATYTLTGTLMDYETKKPVSDANGNVLRVSQEFVPNDVTGTVEVGFLLDTSALSGHKLVAFEVLYEGDSSSTRVIASHENWEDANQTVSVEAPKLSTTQKEPDKQPSTTTEDKTKPKEKTPNTGDSSRASAQIFMLAALFVGMGFVLRQFVERHMSKAPRHMK